MIDHPPLAVSSMLPPNADSGSPGDKKPTGPVDPAWMAEARQDVAATKPPNDALVLIAKGEALRAMGQGALAQTAYRAALCRLS